MYTRVAFVALFIGGVSVAYTAPAIAEARGGEWHDRMAHITEQVRTQAHEVGEHIDRVREHVAEAVRETRERAHSDQHDVSTETWSSSNEEDSVSTPCADTDVSVLEGDEQESADNNTVDEAVQGDDSEEAADESSAESAEDEVQDVQDEEVGSADGAVTTDGDATEEAAPADESTDGTDADTSDTTQDDGAVADTTGDGVEGGAGSEAGTGDGSQTNAGGEDAAGADTPAAVPLVRITEVLFDPGPTAVQGSDANNEWIELYNAGANPVDLAGWSIGDGAATDVLSVDTLMLPAGEYMIITRDPSTDTYWAYGPGTVVVHLNATLGSGGLTNSGESVLLYDEESTVVDAVSWGVASANAPALVMSPSVDIATLSEGESIYRVDPTIDTDTASDWGVHEPNPGV